MNPFHVEDEEGEGDPEPGTEKEIQHSYTQTDKSCPMDLVAPIEKDQHDNIASDVAENFNLDTDYEFSHYFVKQEPDSEMYSTYEADQAATMAIKQERDVCVKAEPEPWREESQPNLGGGEMYVDFEAVQEAHQVVNVKKEIKLEQSFDGSDDWPMDDHLDESFSFENEETDSEPWMVDSPPKAPLLIKTEVEKAVSQATPKNWTVENCLSKPCDIRLERICANNLTKELYFKEVRPQKKVINIKRCEIKLEKLNLADLCPESMQPHDVQSAQPLNGDIPEQKHQVDWRSVSVQLPEKGRRQKSDFYNEGPYRNGYL